MQYSKVAQAYAPDASFALAKLYTFHSIYKSSTTRFPSGYKKTMIFSNHKLDLKRKVLLHKHGDGFLMHLDAHHNSNGNHINHQRGSPITDKRQRDPCQRHESN
jgi:hypothetical protein